MAQPAEQAKMRELAARLLDSARSGKLVWRKTTERKSFLTVMPGVSLTISEKEVSHFNLNLMNQNGDLADFLSSREDRESEPVLREIYNNARRNAMEAERYIQKAMEYLEQV